MLEQTGELIEPPLAEWLQRALLMAPLEKPADHQGARETDMFELDLPAAVVQSIAASIGEAARAGRTSTATRRRGLGGFREAWAEFAAYLETP